MSNSKEKVNNSLFKIALMGAKNGLCLTLLYGVLFWIYAIILSSIHIFKSFELGEMNGLFYTNLFSLTFLIVTFSILVAPGSAILGTIIAVTTFLGAKNLRLLNSFFKTQLAGFVTVIIILILFHLLLSSFLKERLSTEYWETYLFWFILPALIVLSDGFFISKNIYTIQHRKSTTL